MSTTTHRPTSSVTIVAHHPDLVRRAAGCAGAVGNLCQVAHVGPAFAVRCLDADRRRSRSPARGDRPVHPIHLIPNTSNTEYTEYTEQIQQRNS